MTDHTTPLKVEPGPNVLKFATAYKDKISWVTFCAIYNTAPDWFIEENADYLRWGDLGLEWSLSDRIVLKYSDRMETDDILRRQPISASTLKSLVDGNVVSKDDLYILFRNQNIPPSVMVEMMGIIPECYISAIDVHWYQYSNIPTEVFRAAAPFIDFSNLDYCKLTHDSIVEFAECIEWNSFAHDLSYILHELPKSFLESHVLPNLKDILHPYFYDGVSCFVGSVQKHGLTLDLTASDIDHLTLTEMLPLFDDNMITEEWMTEAILRGGKW